MPRSIRYCGQAVGGYPNRFRLIGQMPRDPHAVISTPVATPVLQNRRADQLSSRAAIFWIGILSLTAWTTMIVLFIALL
jgi:hypothetical protein